VRAAAVAAALVAALLATTAVAAVAVAAPARGGPVRLGDAVDPRIADGGAQRQLDAARARWRRLAARSYRMRVRLTCYCPHEVRRPRMIVVRRGRPVGLVAPYLDRFATVPRQFARIQEAIDARVAALTVSYRPSGRPRTIAIDRSRAIVDEEIALAVDRFRRLR